MTFPPSLSKWAHPPRSNTPRSSSSGPPGPCITPSTETCVVVVSFMSQSLLAEFVGVRLLLDRGAELASGIHDWTPSEAKVYPGDCPSGVLLAQVEEWDPPVPMNTVLSRIDPAGNAKADFQAGVVRITANEYETARAVAAGRAPS